jgi:hypothetical protein
MCARKGAKVGDHVIHVIQLGIGRLGAGPSLLRVGGSPGRTVFGEDRRRTSMGRSTIEESPRGPPPLTRAGKPAQTLWNGWGTTEIALIRPPAIWTPRPDRSRSGSVFGESLWW